MSDFHIFIDSDGVLANFSLYCLTHYGKLPEESGSDRAAKAKFWAWVQRHNDTVEPFFASLPKMPNADALVEFCLENFNNVKVLTASGHTPKDGAAQKISWYKKFYPTLEVIVVAKSPDKAAYATPRTILVDDRAKSIDPWVAAGGIGILHTSVDDTIEQLRAFLT